MQEKLERLLSLEQMTDADIAMACSNIPEGRISYPLPNLEGGVVRYQVIHLLKSIKEALVSGSKHCFFSDNRCSPATGKKVSELTGCRYTYKVIDNLIEHNFELD